MRTFIVAVACAALTASCPTTSTAASRDVAAHHRHHVSGIQSVVAPADAAIACADRHLNRVRPGHHVRLTVQLGDAVAVLRGTAMRRGYGFGSDAMLHHATVSVRAGNASLSYRVPRYIPRGKHADEVSVIGSRPTHGYLCLVRFQPGEPATAVVGVVPLFMGGGPELALIAADARKVHPVYADFRRWDVTSSRGSPVVRTGDMQFFGVGASDADSGFPLNFFTVRAGQRRDTSSDHLAAIRHDAHAWWHQFKHPRYGPRLGAVAAWAADQCTLGRQHQAFTVLNRLQKRGRLHTPRGLYPKAKRHYAPWLEHFLVRTGYAH